MKTLLGIAVVVCLTAVSTDAQFGGRLPSGSYSRTCSDISMVGSVLTANCKDQNGETIKSRLYVRDCWGDVTNEFGELVCKNRRLPEGSYLQTCGACATVGSALRCTCRDIKQNSIRTTLDLASCRWGSGITNKDGHLQCD